MAAARELVSASRRRDASFSATRGARAQYRPRVGRCRLAFGSARAHDATHPCRSTPGLHHRRTALSQQVRWRVALVEGAAVLLGILVAFGIQAGWEARQDALRVEAYLASLQLELEDNQTRLGQRVENTARRIARTEAYLAELVASPHGPVSQDSIRGMIGALGPLRVDPLSRAAFDDLVNGGLQSIDDGGLRRLILAYGQALEYDAQRQRAAAEWFETRAQLYDEMEGDLVGALTGDRGWAGRTDLAFDVDPRAFVRNRRYGNLLAARVNHLRNTGASADYVRTAITDLISRLDRP